ncbi:hypothetical protein C8R44DRAFT_309565 [Mycena epipterygia]|nr:hypothetical protein C8R44DRAFT_309565 [Mycena epipterygia]
MSAHSTSMHFGPEWMRAKPAKPHGPSPPPPTATAPAAGASSYSALVSPAPPPPTEKRDEAHPFRYSRDEMLKIYRDGGGKGGLGLEVERWDGIVREVGSEPVGLREMGENEKKLFAGSLNSELRRRQSIDYLSPLSTQGTTSERPRLPHSNSASGTGSPLRERFGGLMRRRDSSDQLSPSVPRKLSLSSAQAPLSPRDAALPSPRTRIGHTPTFDGVLNGGESWVARRRASEAKSVGSARDPDHHEGRGPEIREEDEDASLDSGSNAIHPEIPQTASPSHDPPKAGEEASYSPHVQNGSDLVGTTAPNGPPPGIRDLASVQWSYLDPQGQLQGPFRADLMQKWYDDGYFTADLLMKRTHLDIDWVAVGELAELARLSGSEKLFLSPPLPSGPPGLSRPTDPPGQPLMAPGEQNVYNGPLQPAPVRQLRSSTLDAYVGGSSHSDSPSSSFGAGRFGSGSPDPNGFGGRATQYSTDPAVGGRFGVTSESSSALRRNTFGDPSLEPSAAAFGSRFVAGGATDSYTAPTPTGAFSVVDTFTPTPTGSFTATIDPYSNGSFSPAFNALNGSFGSSPNLTGGLGQGNGFGHIRAPQDSASPANFPEFIGAQQVGGTSFGPGQQYSHLHSSPYTPQQSAAGAPNLFGQASKPILPQPGTQNSGIPAAPTQSPWGAVPDPSNARRTAPFDNVLPTTSNAAINRPTTPLQASPWGAAAQTSEPSPWFAASHGVIDENNWKEERGHSLTFSNLGQHNQQFTSVPEDASKAPVVAKEVAQPLEIPDADAPTKPAVVPPRPPKTRTKSIPQPTAQPPIVPTIPATESTSQVPSGPPKAAWSKEEEAKRPKPSGVALSLRDIQDAESKKAEARKVAERDRDRAVRASSSTAPAPEEAQPFTASWGLPTSQAGVRTAPAKETGAAVSPTTTGAVWTNAVKPGATKKTMKEIQEEEEKRKKLATKETVAAAARRAYAESTSKAPAPPAQGAAWTTVGAKSITPAPVPVRPPIAPAATSTSTSVPRANGVPRAAPAPAKAPAPRVEEYPATASHEFLRWLNDSLKGLNSSVNVEEIMSMLLSFPLDPDLSTVELISDLIYANSTTLDGRRFAAEFVSKRKADAASRPKGASVSGTGAGKSVSIADVVKAQPKPPASSEWGGFKVVNKKKKGGRS